MIQIFLNVIQKYNFKLLIQNEFLKAAEYLTKLFFKLFYTDGSTKLAILFWSLVFYLKYRKLTVKLA